MELKDMILKRGDIVTYKLGGSFVITGDGDFNLEEIDYSRDIGKIERPIKYETIYEASKEILNKEEKEYLENFLRPFNDKVKSISIYDCGGDIYCLIIDIFNQSEIDLPVFKKDKYYKGMELEKEYTLEELGLFKGE